MYEKKLEWIDYVVNVVTFIAGVITLYPFLNVVSLSFSSDKEVLLHPMMIFPSEFNTKSYGVIFRDPLLYSSYMNTVIITVVSSLLGILITIMAAYSLSKKDLVGRKTLVTFFILTMYMGGSGQMIPSFILIKSLGMYNTLWSLIIPGCIGAFYILLLMNYFREDTVYSLIESAKIDGASEPSILAKIVIPVSKPSIATVLLFYMVGHWNAFFSAVLYISSRKKWPLQLYLRDIISSVNVAAAQDPSLVDYISPANIRTAALVVTIVPILMVYPFLQKYFVKGVMIGAVKG